MRIIKQSAELEHELDGHEVLRRVEKAGRTCYKSEARMGVDSCYEFARKLLERGHESVLEHVSISMRVVTDRGISHEIVRHRIASYSQESTRYCNYAKADEICVVEPPGLGTVAAARWRRAVESAEAAYLAMVDGKVSPQLARSVLPTCLKTELVMTMNLREWRHFLRLRLAPAAHPQMRELAGLILGQLRARIPVLFDEFTPWGGEWKP